MLGALVVSVVVLIVVLRGDRRLIDAIHRGDQQAAEEFIAEGVNVNTQGRGGETALHAAIDAGHKDVYMQLLGRGADPNICDAQGTSVVHLAARQDDVFWLREALRHGGNPDAPNTGNRHAPDSTPLFYALRARKPATALALIDAGADVNHQDWVGNAPLRVAIESGLCQVAIRLIEAGADPLLPDRNGATIFTCCGWFTSGTLLSDEDLIVGEEKKADYRRLKALLIEKGYLEAP